MINCKQCSLVVKCTEREHALHLGLNYRDLKPKCAARTTGKTSNTDYSINQVRAPSCPTTRASVPRASLGQTQVQAGGTSHSAVPGK